MHLYLDSGSNSGGKRNVIAAILNFIVLLSTERANRTVLREIIVI